MHTRETQSLRTRGVSGHARVLAILMLLCRVLYSAACYTLPRAILFERDSNGGTAHRS